jgi:hypothetical protein
VDGRVCMVRGVPGECFAYRHVAQDRELPTPRTTPSTGVANTLHKTFYQKPHAAGEASFRARQTKLQRKHAGDRRGDRMHNLPLLALILRQAPPQSREHDLHDALSRRSMDIQPLTECAPEYNTT